MSAVSCVPSVAHAPFSRASAAHSRSAIHRKLSSVSCLSGNAIAAGSAYAPFTMRMAGPSGSSDSRSARERRMYDCRQSPRLWCVSRTSRNRRSVASV